MRRLKNRCTWHCAWFHLKQNIISGGAPSRFHASKLRMDVWYTGGHPNASFESPLGQSLSNFPRNRQLLLAPRWYGVFQSFDIRTLLLSQMKVFRELGALLGPIFKESSRDSTTSTSVQRSVVIHCLSHILLSKSSWSSESLLPLWISSGTYCVQKWKTLSSLGQSAHKCIMHSGLAESQMA